VEVLNLTPHLITVMPHDGEHVRIPQSGVVARCEVDRTSVAILETVEYGVLPVCKIRYHEAGLPEPKEDVMLIVSIVVAQASRRSDLLVVDDEVRDDQGRIIGCRRLAQLFEQPSANR
jgi:hypothetical protein